MCTYFESIDLTLSATLSFPLFSPYFTLNLYIQYARFIRNRSTISENMNGRKKCFGDKLHDILYSCVFDYTATLEPPAEDTLQFLNRHVFSLVHTFIVHIWRFLKRYKFVSFASFAALQSLSEICLSFMFFQIFERF